MNSSSSSPPPRVVIISCSEIARDMRVMRQIRTGKSAGCETVVVGFSSRLPLPPDLTDISFHEMPLHGNHRVRALLTGGLLALSRVVPILADIAFWHRPWMSAARKTILKLDRPDVIIGNDLEGLALAALLGARWPDAKIIFDAHEYYINLTTGFREFLRSTMRRRVLFRYSPQAAFMTTVCDPIAAIYAEKLGRPCGVVYNASQIPASEVAPPDPWDGSRRLKLVHHGMFAADRGQDKLILALGHAPNCELHFHLMAEDPAALAGLRRLADTTAPGRVFFNPPVKPAEIPLMMRQYDLGMCVIEPSCANNLNSLPNKFFDALQSGLGVVIGPSPAMRPIVERYACGMVASSFDPAVVGAGMAVLTPNDVALMQAGARRGGTEINYASESRKVLEMVRQCLAPAKI